MSGGATFARCPACGQAIRVVLAAGTSTQWFPCPHCQRPVPVVGPRTLPVLYSWEVVPGLYPPLPAPRRRRWRPQSVAIAVLGALTVVSFLLAATLAVYGVQASAPASFTVSGTVYGEGFGSSSPLSGARVVLVGEHGFLRVQNTNTFGQFAFANVPAGGVNLSASALGYENGTLATFVSPQYDAGSSGLSISLNQVGHGTATSVVRTPFPDMETFLSTLGGGAAVLALAGVLSGVAVPFARRPRGAAVGVLAGGAGIGVPAVTFLLGIATAFPLLSLASAVAGGLGAFVVAIEAAVLSRTGPAYDAG